MVWIISISVILLIAGLFAAKWFFTIKAQQDEPLTFRHAATLAKQALQDTENKPEIFTRKKGMEPVPFNALEQNKAKSKLRGTFVLQWPKLEIVYTNKDPAEQITLKPEGYEGHARAVFHEEALSSVEVGGEVLDMEDFEMRHAGTIAEQLRMMVHYYLRFPGGSLTIDKMPEPTFKPKLDLRKKGEIKLHGKPPPEKMPNFMDD